MSYVLFGEDVVFFQRLLKSQGLYEGRLDGRWGPKTERGAALFEADSQKIRSSYGSFDMRSEGHISGLLLDAQVLARRFLNRVLEAGIDVKIISGTRTYKEQNRLFRIGRYGNNGKIVTRARGGRSNHNFGIAWDIGIFSADGGYSRKVDDYVEASRIGLTPDLEWGGNWSNFFDPPHYQVNTGLTLRTVRARFERGQAVFA